ncbi:MAG: hypothetical protein H6679_05035 [Epsilonproteobacteria bacterium]|nr:hypothetical protein [Campylobacterota bacterium]
MNKKKSYLLYACIVHACLMLANCGKEEKQNQNPANNATIPAALPTEALQAASSEGHIPTTLPTNMVDYTLRAVIEGGQDSPKQVPQIDFDVENQTGKTLYVTCFSYIKNRDFGNWRWDKSPIYQLNPNQKTTIDIDTIPDERDRNYVFGYLGVCESFEEAELSSYQLLPDRKKLDLDQLSKLKGKKVVIQIERYGFHGEQLEYDFIDKQKPVKAVKELDFMIENQTGQAIYVTCFVYQKRAKGQWIAAIEPKDDMTVWRFDKTELLRLEPGQEAMIDVDTLFANRDRTYVRGYLALFNENEFEIAQQATYELLDSHRKLHLGELRRLHNQKIIIKVEEYGLTSDFIDYTIKPTRKIDFTNIK